MKIENLHNIHDIKIINKGSEDNTLYIENCSNWYKVDVIGFKQIQCSNMHFWVGAITPSTSVLEGINERF